MPSRTKIAVASLGLVASAMLLGACMSSEPSGDVGKGPADGPAMKVIAQDDVFLPDELSAKAGSELVVEIHNEGDDPHEFAIEELDLSTGTIEPGDVAHARFVVPAGSTKFTCTYHGGMDGLIEAKG